MAGACSGLFLARRQAARRVVEPGRFHRARPQAWRTRREGQGDAWDDWTNDIGGPGTLTKSGIGWLRLSGDNSFNGAVLREGRWQIEAHQFRIEALPGQPGQPTPEGVHRDGVDYVLVLLVRRCNINSGTTMIGTTAAGFFSRGIAAPPPSASSDVS